MTTLELLDTIAKRPAMYVDPDSIVSIYFFVQGYYLSRCLHEQRTDEEKRFADDFYDWLRTTHGLDLRPTWGDLLWALVEREAARPIDVFLREVAAFQSPGDRTRAGVRP